MTETKPCIKIEQAKYCPHSTVKETAGEGFVQWSYQCTNWREIGDEQKRLILHACEYPEIPTQTTSAGGAATSSEFSKYPRSEITIRFKNGTNNELNPVNFGRVMVSKYTPESTTTMEYLDFDELINALIFEESDKRHTGALIARMNDQAKEIRQLKETIRLQQVIPRNARTIIDDLSLSVRSHIAYREKLETENDALKHRVETGNRECNRLRERILALEKEAAIFHKENITLKNAYNICHDCTNKDCILNPAIERPKSCPYKGL